MPDDLHGVFATTIYGDKVRVNHYTNWNDAVSLHTSLQYSCLDLFKLVKFFSVRAWDDPEWNQSRFVPLTTLGAAGDADS